MIDRIQTELEQLESKEGIKILYACESGSRAWGFASPDSDWDVRFIYVRPLEWYLSIERKRDVLEYITPDDVDLAGWDLPKALGLLRKSNPPLLEWLRSPLVYLQNAGFVDRFRGLAHESVSLTTCYHHYFSMASGNFKDYLSADLFRRKKYLYVLRPLAACRWIERGLGHPPMEFHDLIFGVGWDSRLLEEVTELVRLKMNSGELGEGPVIPVIHEFIGAELDRLRQLKMPHEPSPPADRFDEFFRRELQLIGK